MLVHSHFVILFQGSGAGRHASGEREFDASGSRVGECGSLGMSVECGRGDRV